MQTRIEIMATIAGITLYPKSEIKLGVNVGDLAENAVELTLLEGSRVAVTIELPEPAQKKIPGIDDAAPVLVGLHTWSETDCAEQNCGNCGRFDPTGETEDEVCSTCHIKCERFQACWWISDNRPPREPELPLDSDPPAEEEPTAIESHTWDTDGCIFHDCHSCTGDPKQNNLETQEPIDPRCLACHVLDSEQEGCNYVSGDIPGMQTGEESTDEEA